MKTKVLRRIACLPLLAAAMLAQIPRPPLPPALPKSIGECSAFAIDGEIKKTLCRVNSSKPITAMVIRDTKDTLLTTWMTQDVPLKQGESYTFFFSVTSICSDVQLEAVIFYDGSHSGASPDPVRKGEDILEKIFEWRRARAQQFLEWKKSYLADAPTLDDEMAVRHFLDSVSVLQKPTLLRSVEESGRVAGIDALLRQADRVRSALGENDLDQGKSEVLRSKSDVRQELIDRWISEKSELFTRSSLDRGDLH